MPDTFSPDTPALTECKAEIAGDPKLQLRRMLNASIAVEAATEIGHYVASFRQRAIAAGKLSFGSVGAMIWSDGTGLISLTFGTTRFGGGEKPFEIAIEEAEAWLIRDEEAEINTTLGLTPDGRFAVELAEG